jgi:type I restriction enzyme, S subunit
VRVRDAAEASSAATILNRTAYGQCTDSGVPHVVALPSHWRMLPLKRLCLRSALYGANEAAETYADDGVRFLRTTDITDDGDVTAEGAVYVTDEAAADYMLQDGDLLLSRSGTLGRSLCFDSRRDGPCAYAGYLVRFIPGPRLVPRYAFWFTKSLSFTDWLRVSVIQSTIGNVNGQKYASMQMPAPPNEEQRAIADFLDRETAKIDALVAKKQRLIELLQEKRTALISRAVTKGLDPDVPMKDSGIEWLGAIPAEWDAVPLGRIASSLQTGPFGSQLHSHEYIDDGTPVINPSNLRDGRVIPDWRCSVDEETAGRLNRHRVEAGDIVFGRRGEMGRCGLVRPAEEGWLCGTGCLRVKLQDELAVPAFFVLQLATNRVRDWLLLESVGSTMDNLNTSVVSRIPVAVPPVGTQQHIVSILAAHTAGLDTLATRVEAAIGCLGELRSALITAAVTGQVDVRAAL